MGLDGNSLIGNLPAELASLEYLNISGTGISGDDDLWWLCDVKSIDLGDSVTLNCSHYCGTVDEECNSTFIGDASCVDVGCTGTGEPTCNSACRLDYSSCSAGSGQMSFQLDLKTDGKGWETAWEIYNLVGKIWENMKSYGNADSIVEFRCMNRDCHIFELSDIGGDGICCGEGSGSYGLKIDGVSVENINHSFGSLISHTIGTCTPAPTMSNRPSSAPRTSNPTVRPSMRPSSSPSFVPSSKPSQVPSIMPSDSPTVSPKPTHSDEPSNTPSMTVEPSAVPSITPTDKPSNIPSLTPTVLSSTVPSQSSTSPTQRPSILPTLFPSMFTT